MRVTNRRKKMFILLTITLMTMFSYRINPASAADQNTDKIFQQDEISEVNIELDEQDFQSMLDNPMEEEYQVASVTYNGQTIENTGVRVKGNSSLRSVASSESDRYSFKLKFDEYIDQDLEGYTKINLNNNFADPSYMREYLTYELMEKMGLPTPNYSYVNVYVNGEHYGFYLAVENIEENYLDRNFNDTSGNLYKADSGASLIWEEGMEVEDTSLNLKIGLEGNTSLLSFIEGLNTGEKVEDYFDVDTYLRYLAVSTVVANMDSYQGMMSHNYYLYEQDGKFTFLPWDHNMSFAGMMGSDPSELLIDEPTAGAVENFPLVDYVLSNDDYKQIYHQYVQETVDLLDNFEERVNSLENLIGTAVENDPTAFYSYEEFTANIGDQEVDGYPGLVGFITNRLEHVQQQLDGEIASYNNGEGLQSNMPAGGMPDDAAGAMPQMNGDLEDGVGGMQRNGEQMQEGGMPEVNGEEMPDMQEGGMPGMRQEGMPGRMQGTNQDATENQKFEFWVVVISVIVLICSILFVNLFKRYHR
ncbi:hypothetical conserved protein [Oceanobacillus iheyensis HTE831]|uniref:Hypothetical conserved protein n=2 Tax=Oceanobacillus iheyensis TaxID=182710 RepID=Q8ENH2_OCEIH|nr:hypothetical conserved protein [Oceanobacillus iheyensis HTE831]